MKQLTNMAVSYILGIGLGLLMGLIGMVTMQHEQQCDDIVRLTDGQLVCEIYIPSEDSVTMKPKQPQTLTLTPVED